MAKSNREKLKPDVSKKNSEQEIEKAKIEDSIEGQSSVLPRIADDPDFLTVKFFWISLTIITVIGTVMRFYGLSSEDLWFDEVQTYIEAIWHRPTGQSHWLFYPIVGKFLNFFSDPTLGSRIYPALLGILTIPLMGIVAGRLLNRTGGLLAALLVMMQPFHIIYSQEARFYAPMMFFATAFIGCAVLLASTEKWYRWLSLPAAFASGFLLLAHHPTTAPVVLFGGGWFIIALAFSRWGFILISSVFQPLKTLPYPRLVLLAVGIVIGLIGYVFAGRWREKAIDALFKTPWGNTPNADFTVSFFAEHFYKFVWTAPVIGALVSAVLCITGIIFLLRKRPWFALLLVGAITATFIAVFAVNLEKGYLLKYGCGMQPFFVMLGAAGATVSLQFIFSRFKNPKSGPFILGGLAVVIIVGMIPPVMKYYQGYKMPLRAQLRWVNENQSEPSQLYIYGHVGYLGMLYQDVLDDKHTLHYIKRQTYKDAGLTEARMMQGMATTGVPTYFLHAWEYDVPSSIMNFLEEDCEEVAYFPPAIETARAGHLYRIPPANEGPTLGEPLISTDHFRRPDMSENGELIFDYAAEVKFAAEIEAGKRYLATIRGISNPVRPWIISLTADGTDPIFLPFVSSEEKEEFEISGIFTAQKSTDQVSISHVLDDPSIPTGQGGLLIAEVEFRMLEDDEQVEQTDAFTLGPLTNALATDEGWQSLPPNLWQQMLHKETGDSVAYRLMDLSAKSGHFIRSIGQVQEGQMVYVRTAIRPREIAGYGGNAQIWFINGQGQVMQQHFLANPSWTYRYPVAMMRTVMLPDNGLYWFEGVRQVPNGARAFAVAYPVWQNDGRKYEEGENILEVVVLEYVAGAPIAAN